MATKQLTHSVLKQDHTGRGVVQAFWGTAALAEAHAILGKRHTEPSTLAGNIWYTAGRQADGRFDVKFV